MIGVQGAGVEKAVAIYMSIFNLAEEVFLLLVMLGFMLYLVWNSAYQVGFPVVMLGIDLVLLAYRSSKQVLWALDIWLSSPWQSELYTTYLDEESEWKTEVMELVELRSTITTYRKGRHLA